MLRPEEEGRIITGIDRFSSELVVSLKRYPDTERDTVIRNATLAMVETALLKLPNDQLRKYVT
jgi:hypothetical protein